MAELTYAELTRPRIDPFTLHAQIYVIEKWMDGWMS